MNKRKELEEYLDHCFKYKVNPNNLHYTLYRVCNGRLFIDILKMSIINMVVSSRRIYVLFNNIYHKG